MGQVSGHAAAPSAMADPSLPDRTVHHRLSESLRFSDEFIGPRALGATSTSSQPATHRRGQDSMQRPCRADARGAPCPAFLTLMCSKSSPGRSRRVIGAAAGVLDVRLNVGDSSQGWVGACSVCRQRCLGGGVDQPGTRWERFLLGCWRRFCGVGDLDSVTSGMFGQIEG